MTYTVYIVERTDISCILLNIKFYHKYNSHYYSIECDNTGSAYRSWNYCITCLLLFIFRTAAVPMNASRSLYGNGKDTNHKTGSSKLSNKIVSASLSSIIYLLIDHLERMAYEVFLGGSCNPTTWRSDIAIPTLQNLGITYYNPVGCSLSSSLCPRLQNNINGFCIAASVAMGS